MVNCEKCGNPLQPGTSTCPICGTTLKSNTEQLTETIESLDETPIIQETTINANTPNQLNVAVEALETVTPITPQPNYAQPMEEQPVQINPINPQQKPEEKPMDFQTSAPKTIEIAPAPMVCGAPSTETPLKKQKKFPGLILTLLVGVVALIVGTGAGFLVSSSMTKPAPVVETPNEEKKKTNATTENGFTFNIDESWVPTTINGKLVITDKDETTSARFSLNNGILSDVNTANIEVSLSTKNGYTNITTEKTKLGKIDAVIVSAKNGENIIQYYYTSSGTENIIFVTVIYENETAHEKNEKKVKSIIESTKYTNDIQNAIEVISPHSQIYDDATYVYFDSITK